MAERRRGPGRSAGDERVEARLEVRVDPAFRRRVRIAAAKADVSMQQYVYEAVRERLERDERGEGLP